MAATAKSEEQVAIAKTCQHIPWCDAYERMISGMLYDPWVKPLGVARYRARLWCHKYNTCFPLDDPDMDSMAVGAQRMDRLREIIGRVGEDAWIEPPFNFDYGCNIRLGERFYANFNLVILDGAIVSFGDRVMIGPNVSIYAVNHEVEVQSRRDDVEYGKPISIGDDCWIGGNVIILPGVSIGHGCTIAAGAIVTRDIPSWSVAMGQPARVVKKVQPVDKLEGIGGERPAEVRGD